MIPGGLILGGLILAIDAAGGACSVAIGRVLPDGVDLLAADERRMQHGHATALVPMIAAVMEQARTKQPGLAMAALDGIAVGIGPGGFTGLRIALATARGLGLALARPVIGISNFQAAAWQAQKAGGAPDIGGDIVVLLDSRRSEPSPPWLAPDLSFREAPCLLDPASLPAYLGRARPGLVTGDLLAAESNSPQPTLADYRLVGYRTVPAAADAAAILHLASQRGDRFRAPARPCYLRDPDVSLPKTPAPGLSPPRGA